MSNRIKFFFFLLFLAGCANPQPPSGGPPDKSPPEIREFEPSNRTLNFKGDEIKIKFNKYMTKNSVIENTFLSPSKKLKLSWSGKTYYIEFEEPLDSNTTYALTLGTDYTDLRQNKPTQAFTLVFSTGKYIDTGSIKGKLYDDTPAGVYIFAYHIEGMNPDTLNPQKTKPLYKTQVGTNGTFEFKALKPGKYRIIAIRDQFKDDIYDEGIDAFSAANEDVTVRDSTAPFVNIKIGHAIDKIPPLLFEAEALSERRIIASFSENLDTASITSGAFSIEDSSGKKKISILHAFLNLQSGSKVELITGEPLDIVSKWKLTVSNDSTLTVRDSSGNAIQDTARIAYFKGSADKDSTRLQLLKLPFADSTKNFNPKKNISFLFNIPFLDDYFRKRITFNNVSANLPAEFKIKWTEENLMQIVPETTLQSDSWFELIFKMDSLNVYSKYLAKDSTVKLRFRTDDIRSYTSVSGTIQDSLKCGGDYILIFSSKESKSKFTTTANEKGEWKFDGIPAGSYSVEIICDANKNGKYDFGNSFPFRHSERFYIYPKEIQLKARWKLEKLILEMK